MRLRLALVSLSLAALLACGGRPHDLQDDAGAPDAGESDAGGLDSGLPFDAGVDAGTSSPCGDGTVEGDELCDNSEVSCSSLGAVWASSGTAKCRADCSGYDVTTCTLSSQLIENVYPKARDARWAGALCNDQTPFAFQISMAPTRTNKWVVSFEGGGSCDGKYNTCAGRNVPLLSSSKLDPDRAPQWSTTNATVLSRDAGVNPTFSDANLVYVNYCSSDGWSGTNTTPRDVPLKNGVTGHFVFTGRNNAKAMTEILFRNYGLDDATSELFITGNSAGGFGAFMNTDLFAARMPKTIGRRKIAVAPSASWLIPFADPNFPYHGYTTVTEAQVGEEVLGIYGYDTNPRCLALAAAMGQSKLACQSGQLAYQALTQPAPVGWGIRVLVAKNRIDQGQMNDYLLPYANTTDPKALAARQTWFDLETSTMANVAWLYAPADPQTDANDPNLHGIIADELVWTFEPPGYPGVTIKSMLTSFWNDEPPMRVEFEGPVPHLDRAN